MKRLFTLAAILLFIATSLNAQNIQIKPSKVVTSYEEYNFLTERYGVMDNAKMLEGYALNHFFEQTVGKYNYNYKLFVESKTQKVKAVFITVTKIKKGDDKVRYICMPFNNPELFQRYVDELTGLGMSMYMGIERLNYTMFESLMDYIYNVEE
jgi:uncharacterized GH25 family protein